MQNTPSTVFISRVLSTSSPLKALSKNLTLIGKSLLAFTPVHFENVPESDWIFFYSQQGVRHFLNQVQPHTLMERRVAAFGPKTGQSLHDEGISVAFTGDGTAGETATAFSLVARGEKVLFARARHSRMSLQKLLSNTIEVLDLVVYDNEPLSTFTVPVCDVLIFTSPLNAITYFKHYELIDHQKVIAIGKTTRETLSKLGIRDVEIPDSPSEAAMVQLLKLHFNL